MTKIEASESPGWYQVGNYMLPIGNVMQPAKSARSTCHGCGLTIAFKESRVGVPHPDYPDSYKWRHIHCAVTDGVIKTVAKEEKMSNKKEKGSIYAGKTYRICPTVHYNDIKCEDDADAVIIQQNLGEIQGAVLPCTKASHSRQSGWFFLTNGDTGVMTRFNVNERFLMEIAKPMVLSQMVPSDFDGLPSTPRDWSMVKNAVDKMKDAGLIASVEHEVQHLKVEKEQVKLTLEEQLKEIDDKYDKRIALIKRQAWSKRQKRNKEPMAVKKVGTGVRWGNVLAWSLAIPAIVGLAKLAMLHM